MHLMQMASINFSHGGLGREKAGLPSLPGFCEIALPPSFLQSKKILSIQIRAAAGQFLFLAARDNLKPQKWQLFVRFGQKNPKLSCCS